MAAEPKAPATRAGLPFETLIDKVLFYPRFDCRKHELSDNIDGYAEDRINELTPLELLEKISQALEDND